MTALGGWQTAVNTVPSPAVEGDFCDTNPRFTLDAGPGGLVAGAAGVVIGRFGWLSYAGIDPDNAPTVVNNYGIAGVAPDGFVAREQQGLITTYLSDAGMTIPAGFMVTLFTEAGLWVKNNGTTAALRGQKCFAAFGTGVASFANAGSSSSASITGSITAGSASITGSVAGNVLNVTAVGSGTLYPGSVLAGTVGGSGVVAGTQIVSQLSGTIGGVGTYAVSVPEQSVSSGTLTTSYGLLNVSAVSSGTLGLGQPLTGGTGALVAGSTITALGTGTGNTGTYVLNNTQASASEAMTTGQVVETAFYAVSAGAPGELVKISRRINAA